MNIDIVPMHNLHADFGIDGFLSVDNSAIYTDLKTWERNPCRHRFTVAHEIGHVIQHNNIYGESKFSDLQSYINFLESIPTDVLHWLETQANNFAGCLLVPTESLRSEYDVFLDKDNGGIKGKILQAQRMGVTDEMIAKYIGEIIAGKL